MQIIKSNFKSCEDTWNNLFKNNSALTIYSSYNFLVYYRKSFYISKNRVGFKDYIYEIKHLGETVAIIPLMGKNGYYYIYGDLCATGYLDFIYAETISVELFEEIFQLLFTKLGNCVLYLNKIREDSVLYKYLSQHHASEKNTVCVSVNCDMPYDEYIASLSKSTRQNIRTSYNRLLKSGKKDELQIYCNQKITHDLANEVMDLYNLRMQQINSRNGSNSQLTTLIGFVRKHLNPITTSLTSINNNFLSVLRIDGVLAAMLWGYIDCEGKCLIVPRLSVNLQYAEYSPGMLIVVQTIQYLYESTLIRDVDLSRGNEPYKYSLGGKNHFTYDFLFTIHEGEIIRP